MYLYQNQEKSSKNRLLTQVVPLYNWAIFATFWAEIANIEVNFWKLFCRARKAHKKNKKAESSEITKIQGGRFAGECPKNHGLR